MPFLQQQQQQSDGFQNLLGVLKANRERDAADLARFKDNNLAISQGGRRDLIAHGVIDEGDTLEGMQGKLNADVEKAAQTKAAENHNYDKALGNGYMASKLGQKGYNEQQTFANAGADSFDERMKNEAGLKFGQDGKAYLWDPDKKQYGYINNDAAKKIVDRNQTYKLDPEGKSGVDALRYAAQMKADANSEAAAGAQQIKNTKAFEKEGASLNPITINKTAMAQKDDADASRQAVDNTVKKAATDTDSIFTAANNESGNAQYNYARGKQYIESMIPAGPERDAAIGRYKEMFMQQQLVGEKGAYMGNIYEDKSKGHAGSRDNIAQARDIMNKSYKVNLGQYRDFGTMFKNDPNAARDAIATALYLKGRGDLPKEVRTLPPGEWKGIYKRLVDAMDSQWQGGRFGESEEDSRVAEWERNGLDHASAVKQARDELYAKDKQKDRKQVSAQTSVLLGSGTP